MTKDGKSVSLDELYEMFKTAGYGEKKDSRYNNPKESPKTSEEIITKIIADTEIYRRARYLIASMWSEDTRPTVLQAQRKQVAYGTEKYPEPLNANTWSIVETIDHAIDESIDKLHYLIMLRIKFEQDEIDNSTIEIIEKIDNMIDSNIASLHYLSEIRNMKVSHLDEETEYLNFPPTVEDILKCQDNKDSLDALASGFKFMGIEPDGAGKLLSAMSTQNKSIKCVGSMTGKEFYAGADLDGDKYIVFPKTLEIKTYTSSDQDEINKKKSDDHEL